MSDEFEAILKRMDRMEQANAERGLTMDDVRKLAREVDAADVVAGMFPGIYGFRAMLEALDHEGHRPVTAADLARVAGAMFAALAEVIRNPNADLTVPQPGQVEPDRLSMPVRAKAPRAPRRKPH